MPLQEPPSPRDPLRLDKQVVAQSQEEEEWALPQHPQGPPALAALLAKSLVFELDSVSKGARHWHISIPTIFNLE